MSLDLSELKKLHDAGWALIYLHPKSKRPLETGWTKGPRLTWEQFKRNFNPSYNVGVRLGEPSKVDGGYLMCLDLDIKDPAYRKIAVAKLKSITNGDIYPEVRSGGGNGSRHLYGVSREPFKMIEIEKYKGKWELCAYSDNRQMVLPGSVHPNGGLYEWVRPLGKLPLFTPTVASRPKEKLVKNNSDLNFQAVDVDLYKSGLDISTIKLIVDGEKANDRSADIFIVCQKMVRLGFTDNQILSVLSDEDNWISGAAYDRRGFDRRAAVDWLYKHTLQKVRYENRPTRIFEECKEDYSKLPRLTRSEVEEIRVGCQPRLPDYEKKGPKVSLRNVVYILERFMEGGLVGFNEFNCRPYFLKDTVYGGIKGKEVSDAEELKLKHYIACHFKFEPSKELCFEAHSVVAQKYKFHPVKEYLESHEWDGVLRLDRWLIDGFQADGPPEYIHAVSRKILCAAVARIYEPGCKFDYMAVLEGNQGEGKSMNLGTLVGTKWFTDSLGDIHNKDVVDQMLGKWLIEISELDSIRGREAESVKAFISRQVDRVRLSYARRAEDYPRQCIFIGSTNDEEYLTDETGNRRYWPVKVGLARRKWLRENRDQLWAEAKYRYELGEKLYLDKDTELLARHQQEQRFQVDDWESDIKGVTEDKKGPFKTGDLWRLIYGTGGQPSLHDCHRIGRIMRRLGYKKSAMRVDGVLGKCWVKQ